MARLIRPCGTLIALTSAGSAVACASGEFGTSEAQVSAPSETGAAGEGGVRGPVSSALAAGDVPLESAGALSDTDGQGGAVGTPEVVMDSGTPVDSHGPGAGDSGHRDVDGGTDTLFVPSGLPNVEVGGGPEGLNLVAFNLAEGSDGALAYHAAVRNDGVSPVCSAGIVVTFYGAQETPVAQRGAPLISGRLYQLRDDPSTITTCVAPGQIAMAAATDLPRAAAVEGLAYLEHSFPAFGLEVVSLDAASVSDFATSASEAGTTFTGKLTNLLEVSVSDPSVYVFAQSLAGRPVGMVSVRQVGSIDVGGAWAFRTPAIEEPGARQTVFALVSVP